MLNSTKHSRTINVAGAMVLCATAILVLARGGVVSGQTEESPETPVAVQMDGASAALAEDAPNTPVLKSVESYDLWVLAPALVAIFLAILIRQVVPALAIGTLVGAYMLVPCRPVAERFSDNPAVDGIRMAVETYLIGSLINPQRIQVVLFTLIIGAMVGVIAANGGTRALVEVVARFASTSRRGQIAGWLAGMFVFFDDYANTMIVGPTMRPMYDRLKISRAKLAYIVDSTSAPIASIALIGTWLGAELGYIEDGLAAAAQAGMPIFLQDINAWDAFVYSIPYRFYPIFALWLVLIIAVLGLDFGPMRRCESAALAAPPADEDAPEAVGDSSKWWLAGIPILVLVCATVAILYFTGLQAMSEGTPATLRNVLRNADSYISILYGSLSALTVGIVLSLISRACSIRNVFDAVTDGMGRMFPAVVILVLAWSLSQVSQDLHLGEIVRERLKDADLSMEWLPLIVFVCAAGVSFATGTSWGTMGILTPPVVTIAAGLAQEGSVPDATAVELFYASIGSVLAGSIFGDHCSPISDTTVLSSVASGCRLEEHVWTQMPYALLAAVVAMAGGNIYCSQLQLPAWMGLVFGGVILVILVIMLGRRRQEPTNAATISPEILERRLGVNKP